MHTQIHNFNPLLHVSGIDHRLQGATPILKREEL